MNKIYKIAKKDLFDLFSRLAAEYRVFVPYEYKDRLVAGEFDAAKEASIVFGGIRQIQPLKSFLTYAREELCCPETPDAKPAIVAGVKQCDLSSLLLQDHVFLKGDFEDPTYAFRRANTLIISADCTCAKETCFCVAMGGKPYPHKYFDINLSDLGDNFLFEAATDKGKAVAGKYKTFFRDARSKDLDERDSVRERVSAEVSGFIGKRGTPDTAAVKGAVKKAYDNLQMWQDFASTCVECGACNLVCPTCHCFLIYDEQLITNHEPRTTNDAHVYGKQYIRGRTWDACLYKTFARVAGGANPRKHLYERLRNRFDKKFAFFPELLDYTACTGCGRCIDACAGNIDLREVLKGLVSGSWKKPPHD
jgi:ferredoxin